MRFSLLHCCLLLLSLALVGSYAVAPEVYWEHILPNTPMPKAIQESLTEWNDGKGTASLDQLLIKWIYTSYVGFGRGKHAPNFLLYPSYGLSKDQLKDYANVASFFLEKDLHQGTKINIHFTKNDQKSMFLPQEVADSIPFSSNNLPQIYNHFAIKPDSMEAEDIKQTLIECEDKGIMGEEKYCATSLESMIDFVTTNLGQKVKVISTEVNAKESTPLQKYKIEMAKKLNGNNAVVCHKQYYAYAVFYCHKIDGTRAYAVSVVGEDGVKVNAVAVCHIDTSKWNPNHVAFQVLKVSPGSVPVCHFLPEDHVVWIPY